MESLADSELDLAQMQQAAHFRGGECKASSMQAGDLFSPLDWQCWRGHVFSMTPNAVLKGRPLVSALRAGEKRLGL